MLDRAHGRVARVDDLRLPLVAQRGERVGRDVERGQLRLKRPRARAMAAREQREDFDRWSATSPGAERPNYYGRGPKDYRRSDERIREEIADRMTDDWTLDASDITVAVTDGEVTLSGTVSSREQKRRAEDVAERVSGVRDVSNHLRVARGWSGGTPETPGKSTSGTPA